MSASPQKRTRLLGLDHTEYGAVAAADLGEHTFCALSVGSDVKFQTEQGKTDVNEDALLAIEDGDLTLLCVADGHYGRESSEDLVRRLDEMSRHVPRNPEELAEVLTQLSKAKKPRWGDRYDSETSLLIAVHNRMFQQCFGLSYGDSSLVHAVPGAVPVRKNERQPWFVSPCTPKSLRPSKADGFGFSTNPGDLVLVFTDGIDECCYREPDRSITEFIMAATLRSAGHEPRAARDALVRQALAGVNGNPGGQDNIALIVTRT